jgi:type IV pilus biogenesis protein CpaD/CtpE
MTNKPRIPQAYLEEFEERVAIRIENGSEEKAAIFMARREVLDYAKKDGADINKLRVMLINAK